jgi:hypothetical protein
MVVRARFAAAAALPTAAATCCRQATQLGQSQLAAQLLQVSMNRGVNTSSGRAMAWRSRGIKGRLLLLRWPRSESSDVMRMT